MSRLALSTAGLVGALLFSTSALAAEIASAPGSAPAAASAKTSAPATPRKALSDNEMAAISGGAEMDVQVLNRQTLTGATTGNTVNANSLVSGQVNFSTGALSGFSGIGNFVVNTGANNTLQGAISVTVVTTPP